MAEQENKKPIQASVAWRGHEYEYREKTSDWYYILAIISGAAAISAVLFHNYLFAVLIVVASLSIAIHAGKRPELKEFRVDGHGIKIGKKLYTYENIDSFWLDRATEPPQLFINLKRPILPLLIVPVGTRDSEIINEILFSNLPTKEFSIPSSQKISDFFGF